MKTVKATFIESGKNPVTYMLHSLNDLGIGLLLLDKFKKHPLADKIILERIKS